MRVIMGVNGTPQSESAARFACHLLDPRRDEVVLYFSPPSVEVAGGDQLAPDLPQTIQEAFVQAVWRRGREAVAPIFGGQEARVTTCLGEHAAAEGMLAAADQLHADLLVVAADSRAPSRLALYLGGVARALSRQARQPVLIVREPSDDLLQSEGGRGMRVLLAHDGSHGSQLAARFLTQLHWPAGSQGYLARVLEWLNLSTSFELQATREVAEVWRWEYERQMGQFREGLKAELGKIRQSLPEIFSSEEPIVLDGHRVQSLCELIEERQMDLIVVGARHLSRLRRMLGSTTSGILQHAHCSCLIVPDQRGP